MLDRGDGVAERVLGRILAATVDGEPVAYVKKKLVPAAAIVIREALQVPGGVEDHDGAKLCESGAGL